MRVQQIVSRTALCGLSSAILLTTGCATISDGVHQSIDVETRSANGQNVAGAACKLENAKGTWYVTTPGHVMVHRAAGALSISCSKAERPFGSTNATSYVQGKIFFGGLLGIGIDLVTGAGFSYEDHYTVRSPDSWTPPATAYPVSPSIAEYAPNDTIPELPAAMRNLTGGEWTMVAAHADEARLCDIDAPLPLITLLTNTQHGTLQIKRGGFAAPDDQAAAACTSGFIYGAQILYRANPGFHGLDHLRYEVVIGGLRFTRNVDIAVE